MANSGDKKITLDILQYYDTKLKSYVNTRYVSKENLYVGINGIGTPENPAEGSILQVGTKQKWGSF